MQIQLNAIDVTIIALYFVVVISVGLYLARREAKDDAEDYFVAGRKLGWFSIGASLFATNISSEHLTGLAADGFRSGLAVGNYEWGASLVLVLLAMVFVPFYVGTRVRTLPEFLDKRFGAGARTYLSVVTILANVLVRVSVALYAGALVIQSLFGVDFWLAVFGLSLTTVVYTAKGGLPAVVYTDAIQAFVLTAGSALLLVAGLSAVGGLRGLFSAIDANMLDMVRPANDPEMPWPGLLFGVPVLGIWYWCTDQVIVQRVLGARDVRQGRLGALFAAGLKILPVLLFVLPGLCGRVLFPQADPKQIFPIMVGSLLPVGARGLVAAGLMAALMSSLSSTLNSTGTLISLDFYQRWCVGASQRSLVRVGRVTTIVVMVFGAAWVTVVMRAESLFQYLQQVQAAISPPIAAVFLLGVFVRRANAKGAMAALLAGLTLGVSFLVATKTGTCRLSFLIAAGINFGVSAVVLLVVSLLTPAPSPDRLEGTTWTSASTRATGAEAEPSDRWLAAAVVLLMVTLWVAFSGPVSALVSRRA